MPEPPLFSLPIHASHEKRTLRSLHTKSRKRTRGEEEEDSDAPTSPAPDESQNSSSGLADKLTSLELSQADIDSSESFGLSWPRPWPPAPFPHRAPSGPKDTKLPHDIIADDLASLKPPIYLPNATYTQSGNKQAIKLRLHHVGVLTTILHRCLLDGDYERGRRAWALLIRSVPGTKGFNLRNDGRWGIGAELLLRKGTSQSTGELQAPRTSPEEYPLANWGPAKEYFERIILQYSFSARLTGSMSNATEFYPALFGNWIYVATALPTPRAQWNEADAISTRMRELQTSPPYSDDIGLFKLRQGVLMWSADLAELVWEDDRATMSFQDYEDAEASRKLDDEWQSRIDQARQEAGQMADRIVDLERQQRERATETAIEI